MFEAAHSILLYKSVSINIYSTSVIQHYTVQCTICGVFFSLQIRCQAVLLLIHTEAFAAGCFQQYLLSLLSPSKFMFNIKQKNFVGQRWLDRQVTNIKSEQNCH